MEFEQQGADRAAYGARLIATLAESLTAEFGRGFDERNLRHMRAFFQCFPIWNAVRTELSWRMRIFIITAGAGFLGSHLCERLLSNGGETIQTSGARLRSVWRHCT